MSNCISTTQISLVFSSGESRKQFRRIKNVRILFFFNAVYIWLWKNLGKSCSNASWGPRAQPTEKCCFWKKLHLIALCIWNKILTTQLYLAHEVDFMFTEEACNLWIESYLLLLKIKLSSENPTWGREDAKIKDCGTFGSPASVWWILLLSRCVQQPIWLSDVSPWCFSSTEVGAEEEPGLRRNSPWDGSSKGGLRIKSDDRVERKTAKEGLCTLLVP